MISTERLINLVNDMLNVSRIESGRIEIAPSAFDLPNLIGEVMVEVDAKSKEKNLTIEQIPTKIPMMFADENKVHQILLNLIGNSLKFTPENGRITVSYQSDGKNIEVSVKDSGVGIGEEDLSSLFKKFSRLDNSYVATASTGGTGLGLYICKSLLDLMKGTIQVKSDGVGKGTTFSFTLPVATPQLLQEAERYHYKPPQARLLEPVAIQAYPNEPA
jgi:signal transduction histidine kinase